jgi:hypothetical protein
MDIARMGHLVEIVEKVEKWKVYTFPLFHGHDDIVNVETPLSRASGDLIQEFVIGKVSDMAAKERSGGPANGSGCDVPPVPALPAAL